MNSIKYLPLTVLLCVTNAGASMDNFYLKPYAGIDAGYQRHTFETGFGNNLFKKQQPAANLYVGTKFNDYFGFEFGIDRSTNKKTDVSLSNPSDPVLGANLNGVMPILLESKSKFSGYHVNLVGNYPVNKQENCSIIGGIGLKRASVRLERNITSIAGGPFVSNVSLSQTKTIIRLSGGVQYFFNEHFGARAYATWEESSKLKPTGVTTQGSNVEARLNNSFGYYVGIIVK